MPKNIRKQKDDGSFYKFFHSKKKRKLDFLFSFKSNYEPEQPAGLNFASTVVPQDQEPAALRLQVNVEL